MWSLINVSSNLHTTDVRLTGLQLCNVVETLCKVVETLWNGST